MNIITLTVDNRIRTNRNALGNTLSRIMSKFTFKNPKYLDAERRGFSTRYIPEYIDAYGMDEESLILPRGSIRQVLGIIKSAGLHCRIDDNRRSLKPVQFDFHGELKKFQKTAVEGMLKRDFGTLSAPTGAGKTIMALAIIAERKQPTLIIVHSKELLNQWIERVETFLGIPSSEIGIIGNGKKFIENRLTVGIVNSVYPLARELKEHVGHLIVDECHRCPSRTFTEAVTAFDCRYMLGLSATPWRRDGLTQLIYWHLGNKVHEVDRSSLIEQGHVLAADVVPRETGFATWVDASTQYQEMLSELVEDNERNSLIVQDVAHEACSETGVCLVLTDRKTHVDILARMLSAKGIEVERLTGAISVKERQRVVTRLNAGLVRVIVATGQLIGEGFDSKHLSTLFIACPIRFDGRLIQYIGRVLRPAPGKEKALIYDYVDSNVGVLDNAARGRQRVYDRAFSPCKNYYRVT